MMADEPDRSDDRPTVPHGDGDGDSTGTAGSRAMLLGPEDLDGLLGREEQRGAAWTIVEERTWPTGGLDSTSGKSKRALQADCITVWRSMGRTAPTRSAWVEVVPYASAEDAELSLRQVPTFFVGTAQPGEEITSERTINDQVVPGVTDTWVFEKSITGPNGSGHGRYVAGTMRRILFLVCLSDPEAPRPWAEVLAVAALQGDRVREALEAP
jgi:hypothetical protein